MGDVSPPSGPASDYPTPQRGGLAGHPPVGGASGADSQDPSGYSQAYGAPDPQSAFSTQFQHHNQFGSQQHAYSSPHDMAQHQALGRGASPYNMTNLMNTLPQQHASFRPGPGQAQAQAQALGQGPRYNTMPPVASASMASGAQPIHHAVAGYAGINAATMNAMNAMNAVPGQPQYYMPQHGPMPQFYGAAMPGPQQQPQDSMSPTRANMAYYPQTGPTAYYYAHAGHFPNQGMQNTMVGGQQYVTQQVPQGDYRLAHQHQHQHQQQQHQHQHQQQIHMGGASSASYPQSQGHADSENKSESRSSVVRGPPRKPRQSGHAVWIGNLPPQTELMSLVYHVCKEAPGLESLFLISKSNCAFANFKDEQTCLSAQQKLHDSKFESVRLVSRLRKSTVEGATGLTAPTGPAASSPQPSSTASRDEPGDVEPSSTASKDDGNDVEVALEAAASSQAGSTPQKDKYFILKSLTVEDLELSVQTGIWATQSHNEKSLNSAFQSAENVYLVFSANKSGEYFGYARMTSPINEDPAAAIEFAPKAQSASDVGLPKAIPTDATEFAPRGSIMDDSERGTIFWEADQPAEEQEEGGGGGGSSAADGEATDDAGSTKSGGAPESKAWGKPFQLEWKSTTHLPFYRARGLRNPWNSNREVKIARDGTELEPSVGRKLTSLFPPRAQGPVAGAAGGLGPQQQPMPAMSMGGGGYAPTRSQYQQWQNRN